MSSYTDKHLGLSYLYNVYQTTMVFLVSKHFTNLTAFGIEQSTKQAKLEYIRKYVV